MEKTISNSFVAQSRRKRALSNVIIGLIGEIIIVLAGVFVPKAIIVAYGSETNGIVNSLQQIVTYLVLFEAGLYGSTLLMLYKPMAENNIDRINKICASCSRLYKIIGSVYCAGALLLSFLYPLIAKQTTYSYIQMFGFSMSVFFACIIQSFFGSQYKVVLMASQKNGIVSVIRTISMTSYYALLIIFSLLKIHPLLTYSLANIAFILRAFLYVFVTKKILPNVSFKKTSDSIEKIKFTQTKSCLFQQICATITLNSSAIILTFLAPMTIVSVFTIYNAVLSGIFLVIDQFNQSMLTSFGNLNVEQHEKVTTTYREYTTIFSLICTLLFACLGSLLYPFIVLYSKGITDIQYVETGVIISTIAIGCLWPFRNQQTVVLSAQGKYNQMNIGAIIEVVSVIGLSIGGYFLFGLTGLLIGKGIGILIRVIECVYTNNKKDNMNSTAFTIKQILLCEICSVITMLLALLLFKTSSMFFDNWLIWILDAFISVLIAITVTFIIRWIFDKHSLNLVKNYYLKIKNKFVTKNTTSIEFETPKTIKINHLICLSKAGNFFEIESSDWETGKINLIDKKAYKALTQRIYSFLDGSVQINDKIYTASQLNNHTNLKCIKIRAHNINVEFITSKIISKKDIKKQKKLIINNFQNAIEAFDPLYIIFPNLKTMDFDCFGYFKNLMVFHKTKKDKKPLN